MSTTSWGRRRLKGVEKHLDQLLAAVDHEDAGEHDAAEYREHDHGVEPHGPLDHLEGDPPSHASVSDDQHHGAKGADAGGLRRRGDAGEDRAQDGEDEEDRRDQRGQGNPDFIDRRHPVKFFHRHRRAVLRPDLAAQRDIGEKQEHHEESGDNDAGKQVAYRFLDERAVDDDDDRRRNDGAQRAPGADGPRDQVVFVAVLHHRRDGHHADHRLHRTHHARTGGEDAAHGNRGQREAPLETPNPQLDGVRTGARRCPSVRAPRP